MPLPTTASLSLASSASVSGTCAMKGVIATCKSFSTARPTSGVATLTTLPGATPSVASKACVIVCIFRSTGGVNTVPSWTVIATTTGYAWPKIASAALVACTKGCAGGSIWSGLITILRLGANAAKKAVSNAITPMTSRRRPTIQANVFSRGSLVKCVIRAALNGRSKLMSLFSGLQHGVRQIELFEPPAARFGAPARNEQRRQGHRNGQRQRGTCQGGD